MIDLSKPIRRKKERSNLGYVEYFGVNRLGRHVISETGEGVGSLTNSYTQKDLEREFENVPEVRESWQPVALCDCSGRPLPMCPRDSLEQCREDIKGHRDYIGILHLTYDGTTLTASVLPCEEEGR